MRLFYGSIPCEGDGSNAIGLNGWDGGWDGLVDANEADEEPGNGEGAC